MNTKLIELLTKRIEMVNKKIESVMFDININEQFMENCEKTDNPFAMSILITQYTDLQDKLNRYNEELEKLEFELECENTRF